MKVAGPAARVALVVVLVVAVLTTRELRIGERQVHAADEAAERGDWWEAVTHARAAAEALVPGSPWPARGWLRLEAIGHDAEARGDDAIATLAYSAMRSAALATRAPGARADRWRAKAEEGLVRVATAQRNLGAPRTDAQSMLAALRTTEPPATFRLALLAAAAAALLGGLGRLSSVQEPRRARVAQAVAAVGGALYATMLLVN
jgi:hypothetical protein